MKTLLVENIERIKKAIPLIENKMKLKIDYSGKNVIIKGEELEEFLGIEIIRAIDFSFDVEDALLLLNPDFALQFINIKDFSRKKDLSEVRSRLIGKNGRAKGTIQELTGSAIAIHENRVGIISDDVHLDSVVQAVTSLIRGSKHANVFAYLEKQNAERKKFDDDLGLKESVKQDFD